MKWETCPDCGRELPADEMKEHQCHCRAAATPTNRAIGADDLANRRTQWPNDAERMFRDHKAHIKRIETDWNRHQAVGR